MLSGDFHRKQPQHPSYESIESFLFYFESNKLSVSSTFSPTDTPDRLNTFLMKNSDPTDPKTLPYQQSVFILLLLHPLIRLSSNQSNHINRLRTLTLQLIGRCVRRSTRFDTKTLPIVIPLLMNHFTDKNILEIIVKDLHFDLNFRFHKKKKNEGEALYSDPLLHNLLIVFDFFYLMNESFDVISYSGHLPFPSFYHPFSEEFIREDYAQWLANQTDPTYAFTLCDYPWIFDLACKRTLLVISNELKQRHQLQDSFFRAIFDGVQLPFLSISIRRTHILLDAFDQIDHLPLHQVTRQLRVTFIGEEGVDEGGLRKEFFQLCFDELSHLNLFTQLTPSNLLWFPQSELTGVPLYYYKLVGLLVGLAIYNNILIQPLFPIFLYKKLLNWPVNLDDFSEIDPQIAHSINQLHMIQNREEVESLHLFHAVNDTIPLIPGGLDIPVTSDSLPNYLQLLTNFYLSDSQAFLSFRSGFESISLGSVMYGYRPDEVYSLIHGTHSFNLSTLRSKTQYDGGFTEDNPTILWFWSIICNSFTLQQQEEFLFFVTGSKRVPIEGIASFTIVRVGTSDRSVNYNNVNHNPNNNRTRTRSITKIESSQLPLPLPTAHTCFNTLLLCEYPSKEELHEKLLISIANNHGFGLI